MSIILKFPLAYAKTGDTGLYNIGIFRSYCIKNVYKKCHPVLDEG